MNKTAATGILNVGNPCVNYYASLLQRWPERKLLSRHERWRKTANQIGLSKEAKNRLEWIIWYETKGEENTSKTARHFGIARKTFHAWLKRFDETSLASLEGKSKAPKNVRQKEFTPLQYERVVKLRKEHIRYGKMKLLKLYEQKHPEDKNISSWKIQCIIQKSGIYYSPAKQAKTNKKRQRSTQKKKITELKRKKASGFLVCMDTVVKYWNGNKRYILTAIDRHSRIAYARMYTTHSSASARDFLYRTYFLLDGKITNVQTDNGSEFHKHFDKACRDLGMDHYWSRAKTPKDNPVNERFNRTLQDEFVALGNMTDNCSLFNKRLTEWLVEYNFK
ncbi:MAG: DDE-type integrase/transposase/recombinase, partial [bacterium]